LPPATPKARRSTTRAASFPAAPSSTTIPANSSGRRGFTQAGTYRIPFSVGDGTSATSVTTTITVLNVNGLPVFDRLGEWQVREGQTLFFRAFAFDPENPSFVPQDRLPDNQLTPLLESEPTVAYTAIGLPVGATFDADTAMFVWTPGFMQAGTYHGRASPPATMATAPVRRQYRR
jgi:hypothetical protein